MRQRWQAGAGKRGMGGSAAWVRTVASPGAAYSFVKASTPPAFGATVSSQTSAFVSPKSASIPVPPLLMSRLPGLMSKWMWTAGA